jgi:hypothetical protein
MFDTSVNGGTIVAIHVLAVLGLSPGPIYNCLRGLYAADQIPERFSLLVTERTKGPHPALVIESLRDIFSETEFNRIDIPSIDRPYTEHFKAVSNLNITPSHFFISTGTVLLVSTIQCVLPPDIIPLEVRSRRNSSSVELVSNNKKEIWTLHEPPLEEVLKIHGVEQLSSNERATFGSGRDKFSMEVDTYVVSGSEEDRMRLHCTNLQTDARAKLQVTFAWKGWNCRKGWWRMATSESGKWQNHFGIRTVDFCASGVIQKSMAKRLTHFGWKVSQ